MLVTDGETRAVVSAARGLAAGGFEVLAAAAGPRALAPTLWSKTASKRITTPHPLTAEADFVDAIERVVLHARPDILLAGSDASLLAVSRARGRFSGQVRVGLPPHGVLERCLSKVELADAATRSDLAPPESALCRDIDEAIEAAHAFGFPLLVKPVRSIIETGRSRRRSGSRLVGNLQELLTVRAQLGEEVLVQRRLPGRIVSFAGALAGGVLIAEAASRYERTWAPLAGNACFSETIAAPDALRRRVLDLLAELGWEGLFELELIQSKRDDWHAIDFNPRPYGSLALAIGAGANLPAIWCRHLLGDNQTPVRARPGVCYRWTDADLRHWLWQLSEGRNEGSHEPLLPRRGVVHPHMRAADPGPAAARLIQLGANALGRSAADRIVTQSAPGLQRSTWTRRAPTVVIGAGPNGLAVTAHLLGAGIETVCLGDPLESWERHMPAGMLLRSRWRSSHIADPGRALTLDDYARAQARRIGEPRLRREEFIDYGRWYARQAVPQLDTRRVVRLTTARGGFRLRLADDEELWASRVVVAAGIEPFKHIPEPFAELPAQVCSHAYDHAELAGFAGRRVAVIGSGQSALECGALLHERGAEVSVLCRALAIRWLAPEVSLTETASGGVLGIQPPPTDVGGRLSGWLAAVPSAFRALPSSLRPTISLRCIRPAGASWLRSRLAGVAFTFGVEVRRAYVSNGEVVLVLNDGTSHRADHVLLGTGYRVDVRRYAFLAPELTRSLRLADGYPVLGAGLESSIPGLYFVGAPAAHSFGPIMRFVVGTWYAAPAVARRITGARQPPLAVAFPRARG